MSGHLASESAVTFNRKRRSRCPGITGHVRSESVVILVRNTHDRHGLPLSVSTHAANHHEVTLVQLSFDFYMIEAKPEALIGDKAYDSDELDKSLKAQGVEMIAPHRSNRKLKTQDGRRLRRYQRRWLVERFFAWLQWKRRLLIRWEYYAENFLGFVELACISMLLKRI